MKQYLFLLLIAAMSVRGAAAVDRDAFTFTRYRLDVQIDRPSHVIAITGQVSMRNDSKTPQKYVCLQVSSSLEWNGIAFQGQPVEWIGNQYTTDIDKTGAVAEAIATLPAAVAPGGTVVLDIQYGGTITRDATRLTRMGAPEEVALRNDWDQISPAFTALRGLGHVVWYPVSIPAVSMSDGSTVFSAIDEWNARHSSTQFDADIQVMSEDVKLCIAGTAATSKCGDLSQATDPQTNETTNEITNRIHLSGLNRVTPAFAIAAYEHLDQPGMMFYYVAESTSTARDFALAAELNVPVLNDWLSPATDSTVLIELTDPNAAPYQDGQFLFTPFRQAPDATLIALMMPAQVAARFRSPRGWIDGGLQRFFQAVALERRTGRNSAIQFLGEYLPALREAEKPSDNESSSNSGKNAAGDSLLSTSDEIRLRGKGAYVFWMLRDMLGDAALQKALVAYRPDSDQNPVYLQGLLEEGKKRDLEWLFDDWVYRDRGLPSFQVSNVYARPIVENPNHLNLVTVTVENQGGAGAEIPVMIQSASGERTIRLLVPAHQKASARSEIPGAPTKVVANDGSVPTVSEPEVTFEVTASQRKN